MQMRLGLPRAASFLLLASFFATPRLALTQASAQVSAPASAAGVELELSYDLLKRIIAQSAFTEDGRRYVKRDGRCSFGYLETPRVGQENGKLWIRARFTGRSAMNLLGKCVGLGDAFDVLIRAVPYVDRTTLRLKEVTVVPEGVNGIYSRGVAKAMTAEIPRVFSYDIAPEAQRLLEAESPGMVVPIRKKLRTFRVGAIRPEKDGLVVEIAFRLAVN